MAYNMNEMRPALVKAHEMGNRKLINAELCAALGVSQAHFAMYDAGMTNLFKAVSEYVRLYNAPRETDTEVKAAREKIFPLWKAVLACGEPDKFSNELRVDAADVEHLAEWATRAIDSQNDLSFGGDENFVSSKVYAVSREKQFRKCVEINLGIRIAGLEVLTDEKRDFLGNERKLCSKIKKGNARITEHESRIAAIQLKAKKYKSAEAKAEAASEIELLTKAVEDIKTSIVGWKESLRVLHETGKMPVKKNAEKAETPEPEIVVAEAPAKAKAATTKKSKAKATTVIVSAPELMPAMA